MIMINNIDKVIIIEDQLQKCASASRHKNI